MTDRPDFTTLKRMIYHGMEVPRDLALAVAEWAEDLERRAMLAFEVCDALDACSRDGLHEHYDPLFESLEAFRREDAGVMRPRTAYPEPGAEPPVEVEALDGVKVVSIEIDGQPHL